MPCCIFSPASSISLYVNTRISPSVVPFTSSSCIYVISFPVSSDSFFSRSFFSAIISPSVVYKALILCSVSDGSPAYINFLSTEISLATLDATLSATSYRTPSPTMIAIFLEVFFIKLTRYPFCDS